MHSSLALIREDSCRFAWIRVPLFCLLIVLLLTACAHAQPATTRATTVPATIRYIGCAPIEGTARDQLSRPFDVHGASGVTFAGNDEYWAVLDNNDKLIRLRVSVGGDGSVTSKTLSGLTMSDRSDNEGIAITPSHKSVYVSEEDTPGIHEYSLADGRRLQTLETPDVYLHGHTVHNRGFESCTLSPDGKTLWTANEHALTVDGTTQAQAEPFGSTTRVHLLRYTIDADGHATPREQFAYQTAGVHALGGFNSLADLVALPNGKLLALERSGGEALGGAKSFLTRIFLVTTDGATDVSKPPFDRGLPAIGATSGPAVLFVHKQLLYEGYVCEARGQNLEGLCLGPELAPGRWLLVGVVDDTDGPFRISHNYVAGFELTMLETGKTR